MPEDNLGSYEIRFSEDYSARPKVENLFYKEVYVEILTDFN